MLRIITNNDTNLDKRINGSYHLIHFSATGLSLGTPTPIIYFKFDNEVNTELSGNNHFNADGYIYNKFGNTTTEFIYYPQMTLDTQLLTFNNVKNIKLNFYDKNNTNLNLTNYTMILKKM